MKDHRIRLRDEDLMLIEEALRIYINKRFEGLSEIEIANLRDLKVDRAIELFDRSTMQIGPPSEGWHP